jgi:hypothetical protein
MITIFLIQVYGKPQLVFCFSVTYDFSVTFSHVMIHFKV